MSGERRKSILDEYLAPSPDNARGAGTDPGFIAGERFVAMLDLELGKGAHVALPYSAMLKARFDPSAGITLEFPGDTVTIEGKGLLAVFKGVIQHRVLRVTAGKELFAEGGHEESSVVTAVRCVPRNIREESQPDELSGSRVNSFSSRSASSGVRFLTACLSMMSMARLRIACRRTIDTKSISIRSSSEGSHQMRSL